ncbi:MAG: reverse transcriptase/maturase family protein [Oscillospiraceae bacterium]|jgi:retron-type reverse transcriptase|nr:reverse transcriptase/maturase family protein [Oscillospiraceae bacterium]
MNTTKVQHYDIVCDWATLKRSYKQTQREQRKYRREHILFDMARERNLVSLWRELKAESYSPGSYIQFKVFEPKERQISAPHIKDKVVQYAAHMALWEAYKDVLIKDTYGCILGRGTHKAVDRTQHFMRLCKWRHGDCWVLKMDVKKFFYTIDREILKGLLRKRIKDERFLRLMDAIIDSSPEGDVGLPLGNVTSQDLANIYLNEVDQYAKRFLGLQYYVRYMDDIIVCLPTKEDAQRTLVYLRDFIRERLRLELNAKTKIFPHSQGINAYGFRIHTTHKQVRTSSKQAMKRRIRAMAWKMKNRKLPYKRVQLAVNSWLGHARHSNSYNLAKKIFRRYPFVTVEHKEYKFGRKPNTS